MYHLKNIQKIFIYLFYLLLGVVAFVGLSKVYSMNIEFHPIHNVIFGVITVIIQLGIFIKGYWLFKRTSDKRMLLLSIGFLFAVFFETLHFLYSNQQGLQFALWYLEAFAYSGGIIASIFYFADPISKHPKYFERKVIGIYTSISILVLFFVFQYIENITMVFVRIPFEVAYIMFFILIAFLFTDMRIAQGKSVFSFYTLGLLLLSNSSFFEPTGEYFSSQYRFTLHFIDLLSLSFIFLGLNDVLFKTKYFSLRYKFLLYHALLVSILYLIIVIYLAFHDEIIFNPSFKYLFFVVFLFLVISGYLLTLKITQPVSNILQGVICNKPGRKPKKINIISNDEVGFLTKEFNNNSELMYKYNAEISEYAEKERQLAKKELELRKIFEKLRSTFSTEKIKKMVVKELGFYYKPARITLFEISQTAYIKNKIVKTVEFLNFETEGFPQVPPLDFEEEKFLIQKKGLVFKENISLSEMETFKKDGCLKTLFKDENFGTTILAPVIYAEKLVGLFVMQFFDKGIFFTQNDQDFINSVIYQTGLALYQVGLYEKTNQIAEKELLIRELLLGIKPYFSIDEVNEYLLEKLSKIFDVDRILFIQKEPHQENCDIKYEYLKNNSNDYLKANFESESIKQEMLKLANINGLTCVLIDNKSQNVDFLFYQRFKISSIIGVPIMNQSKFGEQNIGSLLLCSNEVKDWSENELNTLTGIIESVVPIIDYIKQISEIDKIRNSFIVTLAHDLQVPLVGEHRALEFLLKKANEGELKKYEEIFRELLSNNEELVKQLKKLLDIYTYEAGRKKLENQQHSIKEVLNRLIKNFSEEIRNKLITLNVDIQDNLPLIRIDEIELSKALHSIIENAVKYTPEGGEINITVFSKNNFINIVVQDNGPGITRELKSKIFERYEMAQAIERKGGGGFTLYLSKLIIEAMGGNLSFKSELNKGTTFYITLPLEF